MTAAELHELVALAVDGTLNSEQAAQLAVACREDSTVLDNLTCQLAIERLLHAVERDPHGRITAREIALRLGRERVTSINAPQFVPQVVKLARRRLWLPRLALAASLTILAGGAAWFLQKPPRAPENAFASDGPLSKAMEVAQPLALLKQAADVVWESSGGSGGSGGSAQQPAVGATLPAGWLRWRSGTVQLEFLSGARLLVNGPARLRLESENSAFLEYGKLSAHVPQSARGFGLHAPGFEVIDLGTAFGMEVSSTRPAELHVLDGAVSLGRSGQPASTRTLNAGNAVRIGSDQFEPIALRAGDFPDGEALARRANVSGRERATQWQAAMGDLIRDPATLLSYTFQGEADWSRAVTNHAAQAPNSSHGSLVGTEWAGGRWPGCRAIEFRSRADRLGFTLGGHHSALTLMTWVRVDSLANDYNALLMPSRYQPGSLHWAIERGGELRLTMLNRNTRSVKSEVWDGPVSGPAISSLDFGRWIFLATTYDAATGTVTHYRDGRQIGSGRFQHKLAAVLGPVEFGNWGADGKTSDTVWTRSQQTNHRNRNFVGRVDELTILARVLSAEELARLYAIGKP